MALSTFLLFIFSLFILTLFIYSYTKKLSPSLSIVLLLGVIVRLAYVYLSNGVSNFDLEAYHIIGQSFLGHGNIFPSPANLFYPYFPLFIYIEAASVYLSFFGISYIFIIKMILLLFELGIIYVLYLLFKRNTTIALLYALNPITSLVSGFQGQFDSIPLFFLLLSYYFLILKKEAYAFSMGSFAIAFKTWPIVFLIPVIIHAKNKKHSVLLFLVPIISLILYSYVYQESMSDILKTVYSYRGITGNYGLGYLLALSPASDVVKLYGTLLSNILLIMLVVWIYIKRTTPLQDCLFLFLAFFVITTGFGVQWLAWIIPFLLVSKVRYTILLIVFSTVYLCYVYALWIQSTVISKEVDSGVLLAVMLLVWATFCCMTYTYIKQRSKTYEKTYS